MPAAPIIIVAAVGSGAAAALGTAVVGAVVAGTVSTAAATAVGAGLIAGGITAVQGGSVSQVLKSAVIGGITSGIGAAVGGSVASAVSQSAAAAGYTTIASTLGTIAGQTVGGGVASALGAAAYGQDPVKALIKGGLTAGLSAGVMEAVNFGTSKIEGFDKMPDAVQRATKSALAAGALGQDPEKAALNSFLSSGSRYLGSQLKDYGNELKTSYDAAQAKGTAIENNVSRQQTIVSEYTTLADSLNADYDRVQTLRKAANDAIAAFENGGKTQELADVANAKVKEANDFIAQYDAKFTENKPKLDTLTAELDTLKTTLPTLEKDFTDSKVALEDTTRLFQEQEAKNAETLANTVKNLEVASTTVKNDLGIDLGEDQIKSFVESGDVLGSAQAYVNTTNQASQELGFENYKDQTAAAENDFTPEEAAQWNTFKDTSGVVAGIAPGVDTVGLGGQTDIANVFEPAPVAEAEPAAPVDQTQVAQEDFATPTAPLGQETPSGVQTQPFAYTADQLYEDVASGFEPIDLASYISEPTQVAPPVMEEPTQVADFQTDTLADILGTTPTEPTQVAEAAPPVDQADTFTRLLGETSPQTFAPSEGIQLAAYSPTGTMSDVGYGDIGLRSLIERSRPQDTLSQDVGGAGSITERGLAPTDSATNLTAVTPGSATYSALTGTDPTKTITSDILGEGKDDVRGGIQSSALYSGEESELAPSDLITGKYFSEKPEEKQALEEVGLTGTDATQTQPSTLLASATPATSFPVTDLLPSITSTTLPTSSEAPQTARSLKGTTMEDDYDFEEAWNQALTDYTRLPEEYTAPLQEPPGAEPSPSYNPPDYGEGFIRNLTDESQEFQTENGKVIYYDDGRVATIGNDGRYVMYMPDGSVVDYSNINDPKARVQTFAPGAGGKPSYTYEGGKTYQGTPPSIFDRMAQGITKQFEKDPLRFLTAAGGALAGATSKRTGVQPRGLQSLAGLQGVAGGGADRVQTGATGTRGRGGVRYFERKAEGGVIDGYARGGGLGYLKSAQDGMADRIDATIDNKRPAKLSGGEFVVPADVVSHLGNGNSEAGAKQLYALMERVRKARTGTPKQGKQINPKKYLPK